jgi:hypothetical protein
LVTSGSSFDLEVDPDDFSWLLLDCAAIEDGVDGMWDLDPIETLRASRFCDPIPLRMTAQP